MERTWKVLQKVATDRHSWRELVDGLCPSGGWKDYKIWTCLPSKETYLTKINQAYHKKLFVTFKSVVVNYIESFPLGFGWSLVNNETHEANISNPGLVPASPHRLCWIMTRLHPNMSSASWIRGRERKDQARSHKCQSKAGLNVL